MNTFRRIDHLAFELMSKLCPYAPPEPMKASFNGEPLYQITHRRFGIVFCGPHEAAWNYYQHLRARWFRQQGAPVCCLVNA